MLQCGNGVLEGEEECDGSDLGDNTCQSVIKLPYGFMYILTLSSILQSPYLVLEWTLLCPALFRYQYCRTTL